ncbi:MAG: hypothetical protein ACKVOU_07895 [Cytophagales bacterium]
MKFGEIYERILPLWGANINFEDATTTDGGERYTEDNFYSKKLEKKWDTIQESIPDVDTYGDLMVWTMFQVFQSKAAILINSKVNYFKTASIDPKEIEIQYFENLHQESWEEELEGYERD